MCSRVQDIATEIILWVIATIIVCLSVYLIYLVFKKDIRKQVEAPLHLVEWVYTRSSVTSMSDCTRIVMSVNKTNKPLLLLALSEHESGGFNAHAVSKKGAMGLMQIMPRIWEKTLIEKKIIKERRDLFNVEESIAAGDYVLTECLARSKGDVTKALDLYLGEHNPHYVRAVLANLANLYLLKEKSNEQTKKNDK